MADAPLDPEVVDVPAEFYTDPRDAEMMALSDGRHWSPDIVVREILHHTEQMVISAFEIGRRLLWTKRVMDNRQFTAWCDKSLPFSGATCRRYMQCATFLLGHPELRQPLARAGLKKTLLLTTLPDDQLRELTESSTIAEIPLSELGDIPYMELKRALLKSDGRAEELEKERDALERKLQKANARLAEYAQELTSDEKEILGFIKKHHGEMETAILGRALFWDGIARSFEQLSPQLRAEAVAYWEGLETLFAHERLRFKMLCGEEGWSHTYSDLMARMERLTVLHEVPDGRRMPFYDEHDDTIPFPGSSDAPQE